MIAKNKLSRYQIDQGFQQTYTNLEFLTQVQPHKLGNGFSLPIYKDNKKDRTPSFKQQTKLKFISIQREFQSKSIYRMFSPQKQQKVHKSMTLTKQQMPIAKKKKKIQQVKQSFNQIIKKVVIPQKRLQIGQNLQLKDFTAVQMKLLKQQCLSRGGNLIFEESRQINSHGYLKKLLQIKNSQNFLRSKYNKALHLRLRQSSIFPKTDVSKMTTNFKNIQFQSRFQSGNLDFVSQVSNCEFDIYLRADTNTLGHQNWFNFKLTNHSENNQTLFLNVCNLKRNFKMIRKGQKLHYRQISAVNQQQSDWKVLEEELTIKPVQISHSDTKKKPFYRLSFGLTLKPQTTHQISLLPSYTYSRMLELVQKCQTNQHAQVDILTYSLMGLAIPLVTITNKKSQILSKNKKVLLISCRIHPGQTCGSFMAEGILNQLTKKSQQILQFLSFNIVMLIPMINPDGVVLGNFRTNYLGNDLNRSFGEQNESTFPEVMALKQLGQKIKKQYGNNFLCFLDLHGHSSQKNIFSYGPDFQSTHQKYFPSRFFPKLLQNYSDYFKYSKCTFKLQEYKNNTARGYFLSKLNTMAYTIESSYALYDSRRQDVQNCNNILLLTKDWIQFGRSLIHAVNCWSKASRVPMKSIMQMKKQLNQSIQVQNQEDANTDNDLIVISRLKRQIKKQMVANAREKKKEKKKNQSEASSSDSGDQESDGQSQSQDLPKKQKQKLYRRFFDSNSPHLFPRILRPAIVHPEVQSPPPAPLISVSKVQMQKNKNNIISTRIKRNRYNNIKAVNVNSAYTEYLMRQIKGLDMLKPNVQNMRLQKKQSYHH